MWMWVWQQILIFLTDSVLIRLSVKSSTISIIKSQWLCVFTNVIMNKILLFVSDFLVIIILSILTIFIKYGGLEPYFRGFYCYDSSIHYPYKVRLIRFQMTPESWKLFQSSTISSELALSLSIVIPVLYIVIMEVVIYLKQNTSLSSVASQLYNSAKIFSIGAITTGVRQELFIFFFFFNNW